MVWPKNSPGDIIRKIPQPLEKHKVVHTFRRIRFEDPKAKNLAVKWIRPAPTKSLPDYPKGRPESQNLAPHSPRRPLQDEDIYGIIKSIQSGLASGESANAVTDQARKPIDGTPVARKNDRNDTDPANLPLLMHSRLIEAQRRFKEPKPLPTEEYNEFQRRIRFEDPKAKTIATKWIRPAPTKSLPDYPKGRSESRKLAPHPPRRPLQDEDIYGIIKSIQSGLASAGSADAVPDQARKSIDGIPVGTKNDSNDTDPANLPLSPLMHSRLIEARRRFKEPKPLPTEEYNEFQKLINQNAYGKSWWSIVYCLPLSKVSPAHILASPIRVCVMTSVRLPSAMMIPFTLKRDQRTGRLWQVPDGFEKEATDPNQETTLSDLGGDLVWSASRERALDLHVSNGDRSSVDAKYPPAVPRVSKAWITAQYPAIAHIAYMARHARSRYPRLIPFRWKETFGERLKDVVFREDMADFILSLLRKRVVKLLVDNFEDRTAEGRVGVWRAVEGLPERLITVLWFPPLAQGNERGEKSNIKVIESKPPTYAAFRHEGQLVPLFNLQELLGDKEVVRLRNSWAEAAATGNPTLRFKDAVLRIRKRELSGQLVAALWLLRRYLGMEDVVRVRKGKHSLTPTENLSPKSILNSDP
jgi:hypothetical protein